MVPSSQEFQRHVSWTKSTRVVNKNHSETETVAAATSLFDECLLTYVCSPSKSLASASDPTPVLLIGALKNCFAESEKDAAPSSYSTCIGILFWKHRDRCYCC